MKQRSPVTVFLLSLVTLGIYDLYWLEVNRKTLNEHTTYKKIPTVWLLIAPVLLIIVGFIVTIINGASHASKTVVYNNAYSAGSTTATITSPHVNPALLALSIIFLVAGWIAILAISIMWFFRFSKAVDAYTRGKMSTAVTFLVMFLIHLIGVALVQDAFNDVQAEPLAAAPVAGGTPGMNPAGMPTTFTGNPMPIPPQPPQPLPPQPPQPNSYQPDQNNVQGDPDGPTVPPPPPPVGPAA